MIYLVEDDSSIRELVIYALNSTGLEAKGFEDVVVSITDDMVDVVVNTAELTEAQRAQIEDIVVRKTGMNPEAIVISTLAQQ